MPSETKVRDIAKEMKAITVLANTLKALPDDSTRWRVVHYALEAIGMDAAKAKLHQDKHADDTESGHAQHDELGSSRAGEASGSEQAISGVARKWMTRHQFNVHTLRSVFSVDEDEIDLIAPAIPGDSKSKRVKSALLLKAIAAYLKTGVARVSHDQLKEACVHYDAFDTTNHATYLKSLAKLMSGSKQAGYTLSPSGMSEATSLVKAMTAPSGS